MTGNEGTETTATLEREVTAVDTASAWGAEFPPAASTPFVLGLAEVACHRAVEAQLAAGEITVGTGATIRHLAPSRVGATLRATARLSSRDGRRLEFSVLVEDAGATVAEIDHTRAVVDREAILARLS
jgi:fluoroacetyl-CoA thioesterase